MTTSAKHIFLLDSIAILIFGGYFAFLSVSLATMHLHPVTTLIAALLGYVLADLISGLVHFLGDTFGSKNTPIVGAAFIEPFRYHHIDPEDITKHGFVETNGHNCLVSIPILMIMTHILLKYVATSALAGFALATSYFLVLGVFLTNQFHKWAHTPTPPRFIQFLQHHRIILSPNHHRIHHTSPFTRYFCITTGWLNSLLDSLNFFPLTKSLLRKIPFMLKPAEEYEAR